MQRLNRALWGLSGREKGVLGPCSPIAPRNWSPMRAVALWHIATMAAMYAEVDFLSLLLTAHGQSGWLAGTATQYLMVSCSRRKKPCPPLLVDPALAGIVCAICPLVVRAA
jgi:hypothetical protein